MASDDKVAITMATDDRADMHMAINDEVASPIAPEMGENHMSVEEESQSTSTSVSHGQIDGNADADRRRYVAEPQTTNYAKVQGMAKLREVLKDPGGKIADHIRKINGFNKQLASNEKCKKVRKLLTGDPETPITDDTVPFILAIWCMLGGNIPSMWCERVPGEKKGSKMALTDWGKRMIEELDRLGAIDGYEFDICQAYAAAAENQTRFDWDEAAKDLLNSKDEAEQAAKKPKHNSKPASLGKHGASSPRQSLASKRRTNVAMEMLRQGGDSFADNDDTEDEGNRGGMGNEVMYGDSKKYVPASKAPSTQVDSNRGGLQRPQVPRNDYRDQDDASPLLQKTRPLLGTHRNQDAEVSLGNDAVPRLYRPGLKKTDMSSDKILLDRNSYGRKGGFPVEKSTAPGAKAGMLSSSYQNATTSSGQPLLEARSARQQSPTASSSRTSFEVSASGNRYSAVPHGQSRSGLEHPSVSGGANMTNDSHFGDVDDDLLSPSQQGPMPGRGQNTLKVTSPVARGSGARNEELATANHEDSDRLNEAFSNRNKSGASFPGAQPEDLGQGNPDRTVSSTHLPAIIGHLEDWMKQSNKAKDARIAALEEEVSTWRATGNEIEQLRSRNTELEEVSKKSRRTADLLNSTSALTLLHRAGSMGKRLDTTSLAELLDEMDGNDGTGASEVEGF